MRDESLGRLSGMELKINNPNYLIYYFLYRDLKESFIKYASGDLLDIGCGNKPYKDELKDKIETYTGCDIAQSSEQIVDIICNAWEIPLPDSSYTTVISTQTIEHVEDHQGLVNEAFRLLQPGGYFIVSGPMYWPLHEEPYDFFRFTKHGFRYILEKAGFEIIEIRSNGGKWALCGQSIIQALFPQIKNRKSLKQKTVRTLFNLMGGVKSINKFFLKMDQKYLSEVNTMNYVVVAKKNNP